MSKLQYKISITTRMDKHDGQYSYVIAAWSQYKVYESTLFFHSCGQVITKTMAESSIVRPCPKCRNMLTPESITNRWFMKNTPDRVAADLATMIERLSAGGIPVNLELVRTNKDPYNPNKTDREEQLDYLWKDILKDKQNSNLDRQILKFING